jgi:hypothetical protein
LHLNLLKVIGHFYGLNSIRNIHLDAYVLRVDFKNLKNLKDSIKVRLSKTTRGINMFKSVNIIFSNLEQNLSSYDWSVYKIDCTATIYLARFNIQLNLKTDSYFYDFFNSSKLFFGEKMISKNINMSY